MRRPPAACLLLSYHYYRTVDVGQLAADCGGADIFADSGAFSAYTSGARIGVADYAAWLTTWRHHITAAANLDVIGDPAASAANMAALESAGHRVVPVFHMGTPWTVLGDLCRHHPYVALGGAVAAGADRRAQMAWLIHCFRIAAEHGTVFHGFGVTDRRLTAALPFYSVDSTYWTDGIRFGKVTVWDAARARIVEVPFRDGGKLRRHIAALRESGISPARLADPAFMRAGRRTAAQLRADRDAMVGTAAVAWTRYGQWLQQRHRVPPPRGRGEPGTRLYLAAVGGRDPGDRAHVARVFRRMQGATLSGRRP